MVDRLLSIFWRTPSWDVPLTRRWNHPAISVAMRSAIWGRRVKV